MKKIAFLAAGLVLSVSAFAVDATGKYNGKLTLDFTKVKAALKAKGDKQGGDAKKQAEQAVAMIDAQSKMINSSVLKLELKKDGTLTLAQTVNGKTENETGKWSAKGNAITLTNLTGKNGGPKELKGTISKDGKVLFFDLSSEIKKQSAKSLAGMPSPTGNLTFKR